MYQFTFMNGKGLNMNKEREATKITVDYSDGRSLELDKGIVVRFDPCEDDPDSQIVTFDMVSMSGIEVRDFFMTCIDMISRMIEEGEDED